MEPRQPLSGKKPFYRPGALAQLTFYNTVHLTVRENDVGLPAYDDELKPSDPKNRPAIRQRVGGHFETQRGGYLYGTTT